MVLLNAMTFHDRRKSWENYRKIQAAQTTWFHLEKHSFQERCENCTTLRCVLATSM